MKQFNPFLFFIVCVLAGLAIMGMGEARKGIVPLNNRTAFFTPTADTAHGLIGSYYNDPPGNAQWFTTLELQRVDSVIMFSWSNTPPAPVITHDNYSVRWVGLIEAPVTGTYTFHTNTDDGSRLIINGTNIIDYWGSCCSDHSGQIHLDAGKKYPVIFEMHQIGGGAGVSYFQWSAPGISLQQVPTQYLYAITPETVSKPRISPISALYEGSVHPTITDPTPDAVIRYTLNGSDPSSNSPVYDTSVHINITSSATLKARAFKDGMFASAVAAATYTIIPPYVPTPTFTPSPGVFGDSMKVFIQTALDSATIYYTLDGTTPDTTSRVFTDSIRIDSTTRVKAYAVKAGRTPSQIASATYTILPPSAQAPVFSLAAGTYDKPQQVTITSGTAGAIIHYAYNNDALNAASPVYSSALTISKTTTLKAYAEKDSLRTSNLTVAIYTIGADTSQVTAPQFSIPGGKYNNAQQVVLITNTKGAQVHFTTDGSDPNINSPVFFNAIQVNDSTTIKAYAELQGMKSSGIVSATYLINKQARDTSLISSHLPTPELTISPNPANGMARISWTGMIYTLDGAHVTITDGKGTVMRQVIIQGGYTYYLLNTETFSAGVYFIRVQSGRSVVFGKLIVGK